MEARFYFHPENPQVRLSPHVGPFGHAKVTPFPRPRLGAQRDLAGPHPVPEHRRQWLELESQIGRRVDIMTLTCR